MSPRAMLRGMVVVGSLTALAAAGCASTSGAKMSAGEAIEKRKALMKEQGAAMRAIQAKLKAGQAQAIEPEAQKLVETAKQIPALFPEGSLDPKTSRAKPEIWQKWDAFTATAKTLETKATQLTATARGGNAQATTAAVADLGKTTCGACHDAFRGPEIK
jgi:cytochrome c556